MMARSKKMKILSGISLKEAQKMVKNYRVNVIEKTPKPAIETRSIWFSLENIEKILILLKAEKLAAKRNANGLRIYLARYDTGENTVVLISTEEAKDASGKIYNKDYFDSILPELQKMLPENRGLLCPPDEGCDTNSDIYIA